MINPSKKILFFVLFGIHSFVFSQNTEIMSAPLWIYSENVPDTDFDVQKPSFDDLEKIGRYLLSGMIYGWYFVYTPSDKTRKIDEFFELVPIRSIEKGDPLYYLTEVKNSYPKVFAWARYALNQESLAWIKHWTSASYDTSRGRGSGERSNNIDGLWEAYNNALLSAVRDHARKLEKNKPKEIRGEMLLRENPRLFAEAGAFVADLRLYIRITEVRPYSIF